jgi:predicted Zn-dependent peptidase
MSAEANAETLPDHMRLDFYGNTNNWKQGLAHQRRWLVGQRFTEEGLRAEKPKVNQECEYTERNFATHKFAIAAWNQAVRFERTNVAVKGDVMRAKLAEIQEQRYARLVISNRVTVCLVGGLEPGVALAEIEKELSTIPMRAALKEQPIQQHPATRELTWDLNARHLLLMWRIPEITQPDFPALWVAAQCLAQALNTDAELQKKTGMVLVGAEPLGGNWFYISASLRPESSIEDVRNGLSEKVAAFSGSNGAGMAPFVGNALAGQLVELPTRAMLKSQAPPNMDLAMLEGNVGLQFAMNEYRYGAHRTDVAQGLRKVTAVDVQRAMKEYLPVEKIAAWSLVPEKAPLSK